MLGSIVTVLGLGARGPRRASRETGFAGSRAAPCQRALNQRAARLRRVIDWTGRYASAVRPLRSDARLLHPPQLGLPPPCCLHAADASSRRRSDGRGHSYGDGGALLWAAAAAADNATHTLVATVLNDKYAPLFELWQPRFAAATDANVELVVACLDDEAVAAVRRLDTRARTPRRPDRPRRRGGAARQGPDGVAPRPRGRGRAPARHL